MEWYLAVLKKYAVFTDRARRKEYWMFVLFNFIISFVLGVVEGFMGAQSGVRQSVLGSLYSLAVFIPSIAVGVRRMHDINKSGWFLLIPIYNLILAATEGDSGENRFGPDPKQEQQGRVI
ncbi:MAG: DUF805 domain-containing protein [Candidatus Omnitrophica bacterium]|nr:DUF805 domain-containing protein [Candidatus Omnitrophota bacterium]